MNEDDEIIYQDDEEAENPAFALKKLRERLKTCEAEKQEYLTGWQRAKADFVNARATEAKDREQSARFVKEMVLRDILPALDSFDMAFSNKEAWAKVETGWRTGVESIHSQLLSGLERQGFVPFGAPGEAFDPHLHAPVDVAPVATEAEDETVLAVLERGYRLGDRVVRPAKVRVGQYSKTDKN